MEIQTATQAMATTEEAKPATPTIDEIVTAYVEDQDEQRQERFNVFRECIHDGQVTVSNEDQASEIARMMNRADSELEDVKAIAAAMVARAAARVKNLEFLFLTPLEVWTSAKLVGKKTRSLILPGGKLALRTVPESTKFVDKDATLAWAQEHYKAAVKTVEALDTDKVIAWEELEKKVAPGRESTPAHDSFKVSVPKTK